MGSDVFRNPKDPDVIERLFGYMASTARYLSRFLRRLRHHRPRRDEPEPRRWRQTQIHPGGDGRAFFNTVIVPRIKKVAFCSKWKDGKPNPPTPPLQRGAGGKLSPITFVKYYELEQYEDVLGRAAIKTPTCSITLTKIPITVMSSFAMSRC